MKIGSIILTLFFFVNLNGIAQAKNHALIIAVGDYPDDLGWQDISSAKDVLLIKGALLNQGFTNDEIEILKDCDATKNGIVTAIEKLIDKTNPADRVVIHFSGHGQQIFDNNRDELDGLDEALAAYDAPAKYNQGYMGEQHLRDDELGSLINKLRLKIGTGGQLLLILDACHSGTATRGGKIRGGRAALIPPDYDLPVPTKREISSGFFMENANKPTDELSPFILLSGTTANGVNYEYEDMGSLSFSYYKAVKNVSEDISYR